MRLIIGIEAICEAWTDVSISPNMLINRVYAAFRGPLRRVKRSRETIVRQIRQEKEQTIIFQFPGFTVIRKVIPIEHMTSKNCYRTLFTYHQIHVEKTRN